MARSILAVVGGFVLFNVIGQLLEMALVALAGGGPPADATAYLVVRDRPGVLVVNIGCTMAAGLLAGYMAAKIAASHELRHAAWAAALVTGHLLMGFSTEFAPPVWARVAIVATAGPMMLLGGWVRASAAALAPAPAPRGDGDER